MINLSDHGPILALRRFLDQITLSEVMQAIRPAIPVEDPWPSFLHLETSIRHLPEELRPAYELLVLGSEVRADAIDRIAGTSLVRNLERIGLLQSGRDGFVCTGGRGIIPFNGLYLVADLPAFYPTARSEKQAVFVDRSTMFLARGLPGIHRRSAVEVCCGAGLLSLVAAATASRVVAADIQPEAVNIAQLNAILNLAHDRIEVRQGDLFDAVPSEAFDLVISNPPYLAFPDKLETYYAGDGGADGMDVTRAILRQIGPRLSRDGQAQIMTGSLGTERGPVVIEELREMAVAQRWDIVLVPVFVASLDEYFSLHIINITNAEAFERRVREYCAAHGLTHWIVFLLRIEHAGIGRLRLLNGLVQSPQRLRELRRIRSAVDASRQRMPEADAQAVTQASGTQDGAVTNAALLERARQVIAGGDSSTMRVLPYAKPLIAARGKGCRLWDAEGREYIDLNMAYGPLLFGHRYEPVIRRVTRQLDESGSQLGFQSELGIRVAEKLQRFFPSMELMRFANSGTEANASAVRLARAFTGRRKVILFEGHYHGWSDALFHRYHAPLEQLGNDDFGRALPGTAGVNGMPADALVVRFNCPKALQRCLEEEAGDVAAIVLEPVMGNAGLIPPEAGFLQTVRTLARDHAALLIFDEVITGMRVAEGGAQALYGVRPDLTVVSKVIGGGFPVAAFGGRADVMQPIVEGRTFHGGVYSANATAMSAVEAVLDEIGARGPEIYRQLEETGGQLVTGLRDIFDRLGIPHCVRNIGSLVGVVLTRESRPVIREYRDMRRQGDFERYIAFQHGCQERGVFFHPNMMEPLFLSTAHTPSDLAVALERIEEGARCTLAR